MHFLLSVSLFVCIFVWFSLLLNLTAVVFYLLRKNMLHLR
jgi:hypothetical protein